MSMEKPGLTSEQALNRLLEGNRRYMGGQSTHPNQTVERRLEVIGGQKPFAAILTCADSRVPPEILFDQGIGDLFVIRNAGNVSDDVVLGSIEYAVEHLGVPLVIVLGHQFCGAVTAAVKGGDAPGHIPQILRIIQPAVEKAGNQPGELLANAIRANIELTVEHLRNTEPILARFVREHRLQIVGAFYNLETGAVEFLG